MKWHAYLRLQHLKQGPVQENDFGELVLQEKLELIRIVGEGPLEQLPTRLDEGTAKAGEAMGSEGVGLTHVNDSSFPSPSSSLHLLFTLSTVDTTWFVVREPPIRTHM